MLRETREEKRPTIARNNGLLARASETERAQKAYRSQSGRKGRGVPSSPARSRGLGAPTHCVSGWAPISTQRATRVRSSGRCVCSECGLGLCSVRGRPGLVTGAPGPAEVGQAGCRVWEGSWLWASRKPRGRELAAVRGPTRAWAESFARGADACCPRPRAEARSRAAPPGA